MRQIKEEDLIFGRWYMRNAPIFKLAQFQISNSVLVI